MNLSARKRIARAPELYSQGRPAVNPFLSTHTIQKGTNGFLAYLMAKGIVAGHKITSMRQKRCALTLIACRTNLEEVSGCEQKRCFLRDQMMGVWGQFLCKLLTPKSSVQVQYDIEKDSPVKSSPLSQRNPYFQVQPLYSSSSPYFIIPERSNPWFTQMSKDQIRGSLGCNEQKLSIAVPDESRYDWLPPNRIERIGKIVSNGIHKKMRWKFANLLRRNTLEIQSSRLEQSCISISACCCRELYLASYTHSLFSCNKTGLVGSEALHPLAWQPDQLAAEALHPLAWQPVQERKRKY